MKGPLLLLIFLPGAYAAIAQSSPVSLLYKLVTEKRQTIHTTQKISLFSATGIGRNKEISKVLSAQQFLHLNKAKSRSLYNTRPLSISLLVPYRSQVYELELVQQDVHLNGLPAGKLTGNDKKEKAGKVKALHFRGYINNDAASIASFSVFENGEIMGLFSNNQGNFNLGKTSMGEYIVYNSEDMIVAPGYDCGTDETLVTGNGNNSRPTNEPLAIPPVLCNKLSIYWEVDYSVYNHNFTNNFNNTVNYLSGLFNQVATLYYNEGIIAELSELYVWTTPDTFTTTSSTTGLNAIKNKWNSLGNNFNGDLCMLIDGGTTNNGGRAYVLTGSICNPNFAYAYSNIRGTYNTVPAYSWDVEVITHETGHNLGSRHTQWCGWNTGEGGSCGSIDDCVSVETANTACSTCTAATLTNPSPPAGFKGTIMSYCHLRTGIGINLALGFGPLPQAVIRGNMSASSFCTIQKNTWTGLQSAAWEIPANWSCGSIPTANTDVIIPGGTVNNPVVSSAAVCRKLMQTPNAAVTISQGFSLRVTGTEQ
jgi:Metallo-peptidase family M12